VCLGVEGSANVKKHKGFTLVEVLIVIVVIAALATLIIPRFISQIENAIIAEATSMLGTLLKAYQVVIDVGESPLALTDATNSIEMVRLGLKPLPAAAHFVYSCTAGGTSCTATRKIN
jgi:general secretion pathway protein G